MSLPGSALTPEVLVSRLGDYLVERRFLSAESLQKALELQNNMRIEGEQPPLIGQLLVQLKMIDRATLDQAVTEQILQLRTALTDANQQLEKRVQLRTAELETAMRKLAEANQNKANFVANISHELRTPFTHLKGYLDLLLSSDLGPLTSDQERALRVIQRASDRLERLIEDLILFSFADKGQVTVQMNRIRLTSLCLTMIGRSIPKASEKKITIQLDAPPQLPEILGDEEKLAWVILQLLDNGIKFTPEDGQIVIKLQPEDQFVRIIVRDTGIGIPSERLDEIFEPFHQLDGSSSRKFGGTGLGLALVKKIIEAHGSVIHVSSQVKSGSSFEFLLKTVSD